MFGRYVQTMPADVMRQFSSTAGALLNLAPSWNVAPTHLPPSTPASPP